MTFQCLSFIIVVNQEIEVNDLKFEKHLNAIDENKEALFGIADALWDHPETCYQEEEACKIICEYLENNGFEVTRNLAGISTAFKASFGKGKPSLGILAEYDALSGMSQEACIAEKKSIPGGADCSPAPCACYGGRG